MEEINSGRVVQASRGVVQRALLWAIAAVFLAAGASAQTAPSWEVDPADFESNMNVTGTLVVEDAASADLGNRIGAFVGEEVRGSASPIAVGDKVVYFLTIYGDVNGETIAFRTYQASSQEIVDVSETLSFEANAVEGSIDNPFVWTAVKTEPLGIPSPLAPADGAAGLSSTVLLTWNSTSDAEGYDLQVAADESFSSLSREGSPDGVTSFTLSGLDYNRTYWWRVRSRRASQTSAWSSSRSFTTHTMDVPGLSFPAEGATNVSTRATLEWSAVHGAERYEIQLSAQGLFSPPDFKEEGLTLPEYQARGLAVSTTYFWRVRAHGSSVSSAWSAVASFTTSAVLHVTPGIPRLFGPPDSALVRTGSARLHWLEAPAAASYEIQLSTRPDFTTTVISQSDVKAQEVGIDGLAPNETYYWRVRSHNDTGTSQWSAARQFFRAPAPPASPALSTPAPGARAVSTSPTVAWFNASAAHHYDLEVATDASFQNVAARSLHIEHRSMTVGGLRHGTEYYWRVRSINDGGSGSWSAARSFSTLVAAPQLVSPVDDAAAVERVPTFVWGAVDAADQYEIEISADAAFGTHAASVGGLTSGRFSPEEPLAANTTYYWRVRAAAGGAMGLHSRTFRFRTGDIMTGSADAPLGPPALVQPAQGSRSVPVTAELKWSGATESESYDVQIASDASFKSPVVELTELPQSGASVNGLNHDSSYFWRVRARSGIQVSSWSDVKMFRTAREPPRAPTAIRPVAGYNGVGTTARMRWSEAARASTYTFQLAASESFNTVLEEARDLTSTSTLVEQLQQGETYYWRVRAENESGAGPWSEARPFTVAAATTQNGIFEAGNPAVADLSDVGLRLDFDELDTQALVLATYLTGNPDEPPTGVVSSAGGFWHLEQTGAGSFHSDVCIQLGKIPPDVEPSSLRLFKRSAPGAPWLSLQTVLQPDAVNPKRVCAVGVTSFSDFFLASETAPPVPLRVGPADEETGLARDVTVTWDDASGATAYDVEVSRSSSFSDIAAGLASVESTSGLLQGLESGTTYYWRVRSENGHGASAWSDVGSFRTADSPPDGPELVYPEADAVSIPETVVIQWSAVAGAAAYDVEVGVSADLAEPVFSIDRGVATDITLTDLEPATTYHWRVRAVNDAGEGGWSDVRTFETANTPTTVLAVPALGGPDEGYANASIAPVLSWSPVFAATAYDIQVSSFGKIEVELTGVTGTEAVVQELDYTTDYFWRVRSTGVNGAGPWSMARRFRTAPPAPSTTPIVTGPSSAVVPSGTPFSWLAVERAYDYRIQIATTSLLGTRPESIVLDTTIAAATKFIVPEGVLAAGLDYYWRLQAANGNGSSPWSSIAHFRTAMHAPAAPGLVDPEDGAMLASATPMLLWNAAERATAYEVQISLLPTFDDLLHELSGITNTWIRTPVLRASSTYFWRVRGTGEGGPGAWSDTFSFRMGMNTAVGETDEIPAEATLRQNYPNPFNPTTRIAFGVAEHGLVRLEVFDALGRRVAVLVDRITQPGWHEVEFIGNGLASGIYMAVLTSGRQSVSRRMVLLE